MRHKGRQIIVIMNKKRFNGLIESIKEAGALTGGEQEPPPVMRASVDFSKGVRGKFAGMNLKIIGASEKKRGNVDSPRHERREAKPRSVARLSQNMIKVESMNKKEAAEYLGISTRMLENYATKGRLSVRKEKGATGDIAIYDEGELRKLKAELDAKRAPRPSVVREDGEASAMVRGSASDASGLVSGAFFGRLAEALQGKQTAAASVGEKIMLTLNDASVLTSLSANHLREAIKAKRLKARIIGRGYKVKRVDLDAYIKKL
jgi:excisionase family DNA binding protein